MLGFILSRNLHMLCFHKIPLRQCIACINSGTFLKLTFRFGIVAGVQIEQCQQLMCTDKIRVHGQNLFELNYRQIKASLLTVPQCDIIFFHRLIHGIQTCRIIAQLVHVIICNVTFPIQILTDYPFTERCNNFSHFIIDKAQEISGLNITLVQFQTLVQAFHRTCQISDRCFFKSLIIIKVGKTHQFLI